jgi:hypothetical protein
VWANPRCERSMSTVIVSREFAGARPTSTGIRVLKRLGMGVGDALCLAS